MTDPHLATLAARHPVTIDEVIAIMREIDAALADDDGLKWFNFLYLRVTEAVRDEPPAAGWRDPQWLERLDVVFAGLYFAAIVSWVREREKTARCWRPLLELRKRRDVARIQFALAGMNAHINHDLTLALIRVSQERRRMPRRGSAQHQDFEDVNALLENVQARVTGQLLTGLAGHIDQHLGRVDDAIAFWKVRTARDTAWLNAEILWPLRRVPGAPENFMTSLDRLVGVASHGLLVPTLIDRV